MPIFTNSITLWPPLRTCWTWSLTWSGSLRAIAWWCTLRAISRATLGQTHDFIWLTCKRFLFSASFLFFLLLVHVLFRQKVLRWSMFLNPSFCLIWRASPSKKTPRQEFFKMLRPEVYPCLATRTLPHGSLFVLTKCHYVLMALRIGRNTIRWTRSITERLWKVRSVQSLISRANSQPLPIWKNALYPSLRPI